ncbi:MAG: AbrB/MazE/SpoVT family DNA-binding domain-containing protein [Thermomicrobiales bacterium]|nr:AbrB/MazE/SpoVT family DNA-binding domain-containing protein [Thermomicrobiales bacterium]MCO5220700.1 AbrB/MazE/SpoVT family DNA-binding domain-containing protein [Thermomicrobiales bacterium]
MTRSNLVRVQEKGQVTLPAAVREELGLKRGDLVSVTVTPAGALVTPQKAIAAALLDKIGESLMVQGLTLDDLIESGRAERGDLLREMYGIEPTTPE